MANSKSYFFLDSGDGYRLEDFGGYRIKRPCSQALWQPQHEQTWNLFDAFFTREKDKGWSFQKKIPSNWIMELEGILFNLELTDFGHLGIFPEHAFLWRILSDLITTSKRKDINLLNLFAYSGGATFAAAKAGARVTHLDASKPMVTIARENAKLNHLENSPIRWIVEDVMKFLKREIKRKAQYDLIILDPPSFGRGTQKEVFKLEKDLIPLLTLCKELLSEKPLGCLFSCHTAFFTPLVMKHLLEDLFQKAGGEVRSGEMVLDAKDKTTFSLPLGSYAIWTR